MRYLLLLAAGLLTLSACEKGDEDRIAQAQACLDRATQSTVAECETIVSGISGPRAALIRCSSNFIAQGFTGTRFANAFTALKSTTSGLNSTLAMMSYLTFTVGSSNAAMRAATDIAVSNCTETGLPGMIMFANFAKAATEISTNVGITIDPNNPPTPAQLQAALSSFSGSDTELGESVTNISIIYCDSTSTTKDVTFCAAVNDAASQGGAAAVGARIRALLAQTS